MNPSSDIISETAAIYGISRTDIKGRSHKPRFVQARIEIAKRLRRERGLTIGQIGVMLNRTWWTANYYLDDEWRKHRQQRMLWKKKHADQRKKDRAGAAALPSGRNIGESLRNL